MKQLITIIALVCAVSLFSGCASCDKCCAKKASCGMKCCEDAKTDCAHCAVCSKK